MTYVNCGDWVGSCTAIVELNDGRLELVRWELAACFLLRSPIFRGKRPSMRVLMVSDVYFPRVNGVSTSIETFRRYLAQQGIEVRLVVPRL